MGLSHEYERLSRNMEVGSERQVKRGKSREIRSGRQDPRDKIRETRQ